MRAHIGERRQPPPLFPPGHGGHGRHLLSAGLEPRSGARGTGSFRSRRRPDCVPRMESSFRQAIGAKGPGEGRRRRAPVGGKTDASPDWRRRQTSASRLCSRLKSGKWRGKLAWAVCLSSIAARGIWGGPSRRGCEIGGRSRTRNHRPPHDRRFEAWGPAALRRFNCRGLSHPRINANDGAGDSSSPQVGSAVCGV